MIQNDTSSKPDQSYKENSPTMERVVFYNRPLILGVFAVITIFLGYYMLQIKPEASQTRMIPTYHPYIKNYIDHQQDLKSETSSLRIAVETTKGDIFSKEYQEVLKKINDEVFFVSGVDRPALRSIWTPVVRWTEITVDGIAGGPVIDDSFDGSERSLLDLRQKIFKSGIIGSLVANDFKSCVIQVSIHDIDPGTVIPLIIRDFQISSKLSVTPIKTMISRYTLRALPKYTATSLRVKFVWLDFF